MRRLIFLLLLLPMHLLAQTVCSLESRELLDATLKSLGQSNHSNQPIQALTLDIGKRFIGTPYVEKTLDLPGPEKLVINLTGVDCTTYLETVVSLARIAKTRQLNYEAYEKELENLRYRGGIREAYPSRLHYFSDWIYENQRRGLIKDVTVEIGGKAYPNRPTFMSENPQFYPQLSDPNFVKAMQHYESEIAKRAYHFIPKEEIETFEKNIQAGDLIAITTTLKNLDIVHVGFAYEKNGRIYLMHASSVSKKVEISDKPLSDYLKANKSQTGIMVCRLVDPSQKTGSNAE